MNNVEVALSRLANVVDTSNHYITQLGNVEEWRHRPLLLDAVIPRLNELFRARFVQIEKCHDLGASEENAKD